MENKQHFLNLYLFLCTIYLISVQTGIEVLAYAVKPLLMPSLGLYFYLSIKDKINSFCIHIILALGFATLGGILMILAKGDAKSTFFTFGLLSFLLTHVLYMIAFFTPPNKKKGKGFLQKKPIWIIPFLIFIISYTAYLWPDIPGSLRIPATLYSQVALYMALVILNLKNQIPAKAFHAIIIATLLLIFSDSVTGFIRFKVDQTFINKQHISVLISYYIGQYLFIRGSLILMKSN